MGRSVVLEASVEASFFLGLVVVVEVGRWLMKM